MTCKQFLVFCHVSVAKRHHFVRGILHGDHLKGFCGIFCATFSYQKYDGCGKQENNEPGTHQYGNHDCIWTGLNFIIYKQNETISCTSFLEKSNWVESNCIVYAEWVYWVFAASSCFINYFLMFFPHYLCRNAEKDVVHNYIFISEYWIWKISKAKNELNSPQIRILADKCNGEFNKRVSCLMIPALS